MVGDCREISRREKLTSTTSASTPAEFPPWSDIVLMEMTSTRLKLCLRPRIGRSGAATHKCQRRSSQDAAQRQVAIETMDSRVVAAAGPRLVKQSQPDQVGAIAMSSRYAP